MGDESKGGAKLLLWLGAAASAVTVLTFLGINNIGQLSHRSNPQPTSSPAAPASFPFIVNNSPSPSRTSPDAAACQLRLDANVAYVKAFMRLDANLAVAAQGYANALINDSSATSDPALQADMRTDAFDYQQYAHALVRGGSSPSNDARTWLSLAGSADNSVEIYCIQHG